MLKSVCFVLLGSLNYILLSSLASSQPRCQLNANFSDYVSRRARFFYNSTKDEFNNPVFIAAPSGLRGFAQIFQIILADIFVYHNVNIVEPSQCSYPYRCLIDLSQAHSPGSPYSDEGYLFTQMYIYAAEGANCILANTATKEPPIKGNFMQCSTSQNYSLVDKTFYSHRSNSSILHYLRKFVKYKKLIVSSFYHFEPIFGKLFSSMQLDFDSLNIITHADACSWVNSNFAQLKKWGLQPLRNLSLSLNLGLVWPNGKTFNDNSIFNSVLQIVKDINDMTNECKIGGKLDESHQYCQLKNLGFRINLISRGLDCHRATVLEFYNSLVFNSSASSPVLGLVAGTCSKTIKPVVDASFGYKSIVISSTVESPEYSDVAQYPYFYRTIPSYEAYAPTIVKFLTNQSWNEISFLANNRQFLKKDYFQSASESIKICHDEVIEEEKLTFNAAYESLKSAQKKICQVFAMDYFQKGTCLYLCAAAKLGMHQKNNYLFILANWAKDVFSKEGVDCNGTGAMENCTNKELEEVGDGHLIVKNYMNYNLSLEKDFFQFYSVDAVKVIANAAVKLIKESPHSIYHVNSEVSKLTDALNKSKFTSTTGKELHFNDKHDIGQGSMIILIRRLFYKGICKADNATIGIADNDIISIGDNNTNSFPYDHSIPDNATDTKIPEFDKKIDLCSFLLFMVDWSCCNYSSKITITNHPAGGHMQLVHDRYATTNNRFINNNRKNKSCTFGVMQKVFPSLTCEQSGVVLWVLCIVLFAVTVMVVFWITLHYCRKKDREKYNQPFRDIKNMLVDKEIPRSNVVYNRKLGEGCFGIVFGGEVRIDGPWTPCAVKTMQEHAKQEDKNQFLSEAVVLSKLHHDNIVKLLGVCTESEPFYIVMEMCLYGDLKNFLMARRTSALSSCDSDEISPTRLTQYAIDIASGVNHLHEHSYIHRDLALRNILLDNNYRAKIGDFGLARDIKDYYRVIKNNMLPVRWIAPEAIQYGYFSWQSDVWAYGVVLYEIITFGKFPYGELSNNEVVNEVKRGKTLADYLPADANSIIRALITDCWSYDGPRRPTMATIIERLRENSTCMTPCLDDAPPKQPMEEFTRRPDGKRTERHRSASGDRAGGGNLHGCDSLSKINSQSVTSMTNRQFKIGRYIPEPSTVSAPGRSVGFVSNGSTQELAPFMTSDV